MSLVRLILIATVLFLSACGGDKPLKCKGATSYLDARPAPRIRAPEDLDELDELREMPIPEASPQAQRPAEGGCLESPPVIVGK
jgi:uncharacterized lipoprotein